MSHNVPLPKKKVLHGLKKEDSSTSGDFLTLPVIRSGFDPPEKHTPTQGPNQRPRVSPYRLASHWTAALTIYAGCVWSHGL